MPIRLPLPEIQIFGGGAHAGRRVDVQDFMVMALGAASFAQALEMTAEVYRAAGELMRDAGKLAGVADEGGWWPAFDTNEEALEWLVRAIERAGFTPGDGNGDLARHRRRSEISRRGGTCYRLGLEGRELDSDGDGRDARALARALPDRLDRGPARARTIAEGSRGSRARWVTRVQVIGDDFLVTNAGAWPPPRPRAARATPCW